jgi:hypothetical protein
MRTRIAMKPMPMGLALGGALVLLILWLSHSAASTQGTPKPAAKPVPGPMGAPSAPEGPRDSRFASNLGTASPSGSAAEPIQTPSASLLPVPKMGPPGGHWDHMSYLQGISAGQGEAGCQEAIRRTSAHLSIDATRVSDFQVAARQSVLEMEQALEVRKRELSTAPPAEGSSVLSEQDRLSEGRYAAARSKALDRLEGFLTQCPVHQEFRWAFDSWASMVANKTRGEDR